MLTLSKSEIIPALTAHYEQQLRESTYRLFAFEEKYAMSFPAFEKHVQDAEEEDFDQWEDYISWKGHRKAAHELSKRIKTIQDGLFELA